MKGRTIEAYGEYRPLLVVLPMALIAVAAGMALAKDPGRLGLLAAGGAALAALALARPEVVFVLFLTAGFYKSDPRFQVPGVDATVLFGVLTLAGLLWAAYRGRARTGLPPMRMLLPYLAIVWLGALSLMYTEAPVYGKEKLLRFSTITAFSMLAPFYLMTGWKRTRSFFTAFVLLAAFMLWDLVQKAGGATRAEKHISAFGADYLSLGYVLGASFIVAFFCLFLTEGSPLKKLLFLLLVCPALVYGLMVTGARGPLIFLVASVVMAALIARRPGKHWRRLAFWVLAAFAAATAYFVFNFQDFERMAARMEILGAGGGASGLERRGLVAAALDAMSEPGNLARGLGMGGFAVHYVGYDEVHGSYPHNIFLELGTELGLAGVLAGFLLLFWSYRRVKAAVTSSEGGGEYFTAVAVLAFFIFTALNAMKSGDLNDNRLLFTAVGLIYSLGGGRKEGGDG